MRLLLTGLAALLVLSACEPPLGLGLATTRELENGALARLASARSVELAGSYLDSGDPWQVVVQVRQEGARHLVASSRGMDLEAILIGKDCYLRSQELLTLQLNGRLRTHSLAKSARNR